MFAIFIGSVSKSFSSKKYTILNFSLFSHVQNATENTGKYENYICLRIHTSFVSTGNIFPTVGIDMKQNAAVKNRMP